MFQQTTEIVFATDFSDSSHAVIPAVARWVDELGAKLTLLHVYDPKKVIHRDAQSRLQSFFAEADNYPDCERVLIGGDVCEGIATYCARRSGAFLVLPPSDQSGLPRPWHRSMRARLIEQLDIPIWTLGRTNVGDSEPSSDRHIGVWITDAEEGVSQVRQAAQYVTQTGATLHLLHVVEDVNEGSLTNPLTTRSPMGIESAEVWLGELLEGLRGLKVEVHVAQGSADRELPRLLRRSGVEMLLVSQKSAIRRSMMRSTINPVFRKCPASLICVPYRGRLEDMWRGVEASAAA
ncbi:MAG: universal stress protein [Acidobacteriaceae bacterium]|nr:universal stress protein [Acidobacteriaceae bacterium]